MKKLFHIVMAIVVLSAWAVLCAVVLRAGYRGPLSPRAVSTPVLAPVAYAVADTVPVRSSDGAVTEWTGKMLLLLDPASRNIHGLACRAVELGLKADGNIVFRPRPDWDKE
jgi:hypothetical protein